MGGDDAGSLERLHRWESSGGVWRVVRRTSSAVEIALFTCDGGEEMGRLTSSDPAVLGYVSDRTAGES